MSDTPDYSRGEPPPLPNDGISMHALVGDFVLECRFGEPAARVELAHLLDERMAYGRKKYGTLLQANNGRDPLNDLIDELLDALVYMRQYLAEGRPGSATSMRDRYALLVHLTLEMLTTREANNADSRDSQGPANGSAVDYSAL